MGKNAVVVILLMAIIIAGFYYSNISDNSQNNVEENQNLTINISNYGPLDYFSNSQQKHWGHMPLTYKFESECRERLKALMISAFNNITNETKGLVYFNETYGNADISIECRDSAPSDMTIADARYDTDYEFTNLIVHADINVYGQGFACVTGYPSVEVHEVLHTFGFLHNPIINSIMDEYSADSSNDCKITRIDKEYVSCLNYIYSNGTISGNCSNINTIVTTKTNPCENGWYLDKSEKYCCPYPDMIINSEGYCASA